MICTLKNAALLALATAAAALPTVAAAAPLPTWYGSYVWEENVGRHGGDAPGEGIVAFRTYTLRLGPSAGATGCLLTGEGFQLYERLQCTATPEMDSVVIKYYNFRNAGPYAMGAPLFRMTRTNHGLVTRLQALRPGSDLTRTTGRLFRPAR